MRPLVASSAFTPRTFDPDDPNLVSELQNLELNNMDLQVTGAQHRAMSPVVTMPTTAHVQHKLTCSVINHIARSGHNNPFLKNIIINH